VAAVLKGRIRVVLADDHPVVRDGLAAIVNQQADMEVVGEAGDGEEAIALYEQHRPDVMVLDLRMPRRDGVAVVQRVLEINPKACILIMTTYDGDEDIFQCLSQGAKGYLLKDAPRQEILSAAVDHRGHRQDAREGHPHETRCHQPDRGGGRRPQARPHPPVVSLLHL